MSSRCFRRINVRGLHRISRLRDGNIFFRWRLRLLRRNGNRLWRGRRRFWFQFRNCHLRFLRRWRLRFFFRLWRWRFNYWLRLWRNDNWFWRFGFWRPGQRHVNVGLVENFRRLWRGRFQIEKNDGVKRQRERVKDEQRTFHCFGGARLLTSRFVERSGTAREDARPTKSSFIGALHCFSLVSIATFVMPAFRKSSSTSTAAPKNAFSSPLMKTFGSGCSVFNCCKRAGS